MIEVKLNKVFIQLQKYDWIAMNHLIFPRFLTKKVFKQVLSISSRNFYLSRRVLMAQEEVLDATQAKLLEEKCILVDENDFVQGCATKLECHLKKNIIEVGMLHRAFSVFLFNSEGKLLLQQRAKEKITFPNYFTNTCCSHPLYNEEELDEHDCLGVKRAAQRRLNYELGIPTTEIALQDIRFLTRIHYKAASDDKWGEHEMDYVLFIQKDIKLNPNLNEVQKWDYVTQKEVCQLLAEEGKDETSRLVTPWFKLIAKDLLFRWWDNLDNLKQFEDQKTIHRM